jgi:predicted nucleic acid-binding protein
LALPVYVLVMSDRPARYVITPDVALHLAERNAVVGPQVKLVAPTLLRSQVLSIAYRRVRAGEITKAVADAQLEYIRRLQLRLLGDRVLQATAWKVAAEFYWPDTYEAEYVALTLLQADALVTFDQDLRAAASRKVRVAPVDELVQ